MQIRRRAVEHIHHQFYAARLDPIADHVAEQAVAADLRIEFAIEAQFDGFRTYGDAVVDRPLQQL